MGQGLNVPAIPNLTCRGWFSNSPSRKYFGLGNEIQKWGFYSALNFLIPDIYILAFVTYEIFNKAHYSYEPLIMKSWLDEKIPVVSIFVIPYLSFHLLAALVVPLLSLKIGNYKAFLVNGIAIIVGQLCLDVAYLFFQTQVPRTPVPGNSPFDWVLVHLVYGNDQPLNGFPSNHVTWSVISIIALWRLRSRAPRTSWALMAWFVLILPATVFLHQHFLIDIYGGIFVAFTAYWACSFLIEKPNLKLN